MRSAEEVSAATFFGGGRSGPLKKPNKRFVRQRPTREEILNGRRGMYDWSQQIEEASLRPPPTPSAEKFALPEKKVKKRSVRLAPSEAKVGAGSGPTFGR